MKHANDRLPHRQRRLQEEEDEPVCSNAIEVLTSAYPENSSRIDSGGHRRSHAQRRMRAAGRAVEWFESGRAAGATDQFAVTGYNPAQYERWVAWICILRTDIVLDLQKQGEAL